jgi:amino acid adenylation domain-containing protein
MNRKRVPMPTSADISPLAFTIEDTEDSIPARFGRVARAFPQRTAIAVDDQRVTYRALDRRSDRLASTVVEHGQGRPVAIRLPLGAPLVTAIIGVLKAGHPVVVLDPSDETERIRNIAVDADCALLIGDAPDNGFDKVMAVQFADAVENQKPFLPETIDPERLSLFIYTSGSTGTPKGIAHSHRNFLHQCLQYTATGGLTHRDRFSLLTPPNYGVSTLPLFGALLNGASLHPFDVKTAARDGVTDWLRDHRITVYHAVPSMFRSLCDNARNKRFDDLRLIRLGGDVATGTDLAGFRAGPFPDQCQLMISFGTSETGTPLLALFKRTGDPVEGNLALDRVIDNFEVDVIDDSGRPIHDDRPGQLTIKTRYMADGYWQRPRETKAAFVADRSAPGGRVYHTGDIVRRTDTGAIVPLGRAMRHININGHRIELDEIETAILKIDSVQDACVTISPRALRSPRLIAHIVPKRAAETQPTDWRNLIAHRLPEHMLPHRIALHREFPRLPNGKTDREALARADRERSSSDDDKKETPIAEFERRIARIWANRLDCVAITLNDDFIDLGGDSMTAVDTLADVERDFGVRLSPSVFATTSTLRGFAQAVSAALGERGTSPIIPVQPDGVGIPIFFIHAIDGSVYWLRALTNQLALDRPIYGLESPAVRGDPRQAASIQRMAEIYADAVEETVQDPTLAVSLCGYCMGGTIAIAMSRILDERGRKIASLTLMDTPLLLAQENIQRNLPPSRKQMRQLQRWHKNLQRDLADKGEKGDINTHEHRRRVQSHHHAILERYRPEPAPLRPTFIKVEVPRLQDGIDRRASMIQAIKPEPNVITVPGDHLTFLSGQQLPVLADVLRPRI